MKYTTLPNTDIEVSKICLGTMTWGRQNTLEEGCAQMDYALERGVNFFDTAEMYPIPPNAETYAETERIIGHWFKNTGNRHQIILASKVVGIGSQSAHIRTEGFTSEAIRDAVEQSLRRLQTDYIDLYQLHWPERRTNFFGVRDYKHDPNDPWTDNFNTILSALKTLISEGKIRTVGVSNERSWGVMRYLEASKTQHLPRISTIQNPYSLLNRTFEGDLAEMSIRERVGLLAYSPMAFGVLSGKYITGTATRQARLHRFPSYKRYTNEQALKATQKYLEISKKATMSLAQMALAFVTQQPFVTSNIIGATNLTQLKENIDSVYITLNDDILHQIDAVHAEIPNPAP